MRRHVLIGRFGTNDKTSVVAASSEVATELQFVVSQRRLEHGIGRALNDLARLKIFPSEMA